MSRDITGRVQRLKDGRLLARTPDGTYWVSTADGKTRTETRDVIVVGRTTDHEQP